MEPLILAIIGVFVGLAGGLFGIGGSIVLIPSLTEYLGPDQHRYQAAAMIVTFFVAFPAVYQHRKAGAIQGRTVARLLPLTIVAVIGGVALSEAGWFAGDGEAWLRLLFGLFVLGSAVAEILRMLRGRLRNGRANASPSNAPSAQTWNHCAAVALPTGIVAGFLGVGGGVLAVPLQRRFLNMPLRAAIANSATVIVATSLIGATIKNLAYIADNHDPWDALQLAVFVVPTAMAGSFLGSRLTHSLPHRMLRGLFLCLLLIAGTRFVMGAVSPLHQKHLAPSTRLEESRSG